MLAKCVKTERFGVFDIPQIAVRRCGKLNAVGIVALVEQTVEIMRLAVQTQYGATVCGLHRNFPERKIGRNGIFPTLNRETIHIRIIGRPQVRILNVHRYTFTGELCCDRGVFGFICDSFQRCFASPDSDDNAVERRCDVQGLDILLRYKFQPRHPAHTGGRRIPHTAALFRLFSVGNIGIQ